MKVLIAEDDMNIRLGLSDLLESEGYEPIEAEDGQQAIEHFTLGQPDIVLLDIMMPKMDGYTVCRKIRQLDENVPVIFITAKSEEIDQVLGLELGADDYIKKPFGTREVIARIKAVTRRCLQQTTSIESSNSDSFQMADLTIFPDQLRAQRSDTKLELSLRDIKILQLLYRQEGKVVDRDMIFNECWGRDYLPSSRTLDQHISKLRKHIETDPKHPTIVKTVHGLGYRYDN
ncbi:response regulator transcription factor [Neptuniibacter sp. UBA6509]|uniref:response regulator transcription factor n=2 Tax=unclassified Neptuniibacter TaxID=2630693 RepID=UPI000C37C95B|nr:response regulator transcription factor [Neptuniibacter sp. UBA6509]MAY42473.1 DNA-binding response regulator [Oceanospirillaceae bacterium]|tara:strand:+ start:2964 stop:3656 length:693 start_codon:yes stop_codon:yes gene_type:complete